MTLQIGDLVRIPAMNATGRITRISERLRHGKYLVLINGSVERAFDLSELEKLPDRAWGPMMPPAGMP